MVIQLQTSFVPQKAPVMIPTGKFTLGRSVNLFALVSIIVFACIALLAAGVFFYRLNLLGDIARMDLELAAAKKSFEPAFVNKTVLLSKRIGATRTILANHRSLTPLFDLLEKKTLESVRFQGFDFNARGKQALLSMVGEARSFNAIALQSDIFGNERYFKNPVFSNFTLNDRGDVLFNFKTEVDPVLLLYRETLIGVASTTDEVDTGVGLFEVE